MLDNDDLIARVQQWLNSNETIPYGSPESERLLDVEHHNEAYELIEHLLAQLQTAQERIKQLENDNTKKL